MVAENFQRALKLVLVDEGGLDDDPHDHGGRTAHGIIQREYDGFRARHGQPPQDVWKITPAEYTEIYHHRYWMPWCDRLPAGMDYAFFDACVNAGPAQAARTLQRALGLRADGNMGDVTLSRVKDLFEKGHGQQVIRDYCEARRAFYRALAQFPRYGRGWLSRVNHVERAALSMLVTGDAQRSGLDDETKVQASARARAEDAKTPTISPEAGTAGTAATTGGAIVVDTIGNATSQLTQFQDVVSWVKYILLALALVSLSVTIYSLWKSSKTKAVTG